MMGGSIKREVGQGEIVNAELKAELRAELWEDDDWRK
jgi:hypothetical protein